MAIVTSKATKCGTDQIDDETRASFVRFLIPKYSTSAFLFCFSRSQDKVISNN